MPAGRRRCCGRGVRDPVRRRALETVGAATADGPHEMLTLLEEELMRRLCETAGLGLVRHTSSIIAATGGAVAIGDLSVAAGVSGTHLAQRFKEIIGVTPKRLARTYRFAAT